MPLLTGRRARTEPSRESRALSFITPPIGVRVDAMQSGFGGNVDQAMQSHAVWKSVRLVADVISCMTPIVYKGPGIGFGQSDRLPTPPVLLQPSADADGPDFTYMVMVSLLLRGNAFGKIVSFDGQGRPTQIELVHPDRVRLKELTDGTLEYKFGNEVVPREFVWHKRGYRMPGLPLGLSPIKYAQGVIQQSHNAQLFGNRWFEDGGHPSGVLTNDAIKTIDAGESDTIKKRFLQAVRGGREPVVMAGGWKYQQISVNAEESQFLLTQKYTGAAICGFFGVPPELVGEASEGSSITYANVESRAIDFEKFSLSGWIGRVERAYTALVPRGQYVKLDTSALLRTDLLTQYQAMHLLVGSRIITQDEARAMQDWPALTAAQRTQIDALVTPIPPPIGSPKIGD
jgi:HK97 family phage portal protein